jgi:glycerol-3-phosphate dehydrogenase
MKRDLGGLDDRTFDVIVVGGGIMGSGVARDAALRGLNTLLLEKEDFACGTTSSSTRLIHGGLRYLNQLEFKLVRQDMREREILLHIAPHLVFPLRFLIPIAKTMDKIALPIGMLLYDLLSFDKSLPGRKRISTNEVMNLEPDLDAAGISGAYFYYDCQVPFTERLCLENVISATESGATAINYAKVTGLVKSGDSVSGVQLEDIVSGKQYQVKSRVVVNTTGHWMDDVQKTFGSSTRQMIRRTKGIHLVTRQVSNNAIVSFAPSDGRLFFVIPWLDYSLIGTTDTDYPGDVDCVVANADDVAYLLAAAQHIFPSLKDDDVLYTMAGLRALVIKEGKSASDTSRAHRLVDHERTDNLKGYVSLLGGKITGYRGISEETVNLVCRKLGHKTPCKTAEIPLPGAPVVSREEIQQTAQQGGLDESTVAHLVAIYGSRYSAIIDLAAKDPKGKQPLCAHSPDIVAQVWHAVEEESALTLNDFLLRRGAAGFASCQGLDAMEPIAQEMGRLLGWSASERKNQIESYRSWAALNNSWRQSSEAAP